METTRPSMQETAETTPWETTGMADTLYDDPQNGINGTAGTEDGAGSMATDETNETGGLMNDVTDGLEQIGDDITGAVDDVVDGNRARR